MSHQGYQQGYDQNYQQGYDQIYQQGGQQSYDQGYAQTAFQTQGHHVQQQIQPGGQPMGQPTHGSGAWHTSDSGSFNGGTYQISHRDTNSILSISLQQGGAVKSKPGAMIEMAGTIKLEGKTKFSFGKMLTGGSMHESLYTGTGAVTLAPVLLGDIATLQIDGRVPWKIGKDAFLAATPDVKKESKSQGIGKALFSGEYLFVYHVSGQGLMWVSSFGAITRREIPGETHIVDNGHLVAWNCDYKIEKAGGGIFTSMKTGEGAVCRFIGPGTVYIQTRNLEDFAQIVAEAAGLAKS